MPHREILGKLDAPFPYACYKANYEGYASVSPQMTSDRLNEVFGPAGWKLEVDNETVDNYSVSIRGRLSIKNEQGEWIGKTQYGDAVMVILNGKTEPSVQASLDARKKAMSDSLKKCASLFGVASHVYTGRVEVIKGKNSDYYKVIRALDLVASEHKEGICVLPDDFKAYYKEQNWEGVFVSDVNKALSQRVPHSSRSEDPAHPLQSRNSSYKDQKQTTSNPVAKPPEAHLHFELKDVNAHTGGDQSVYYELLCLYGTGECSVFAVGEVIKDVEQLQYGSKFNMDTQLQGGRRVVTSIQKVS